jgi:hypothetical protein
MHDSDLPDNLSSAVRAEWVLLSLGIVVIGCTMVIALAHRLSLIHRRSTNTGKRQSRNLLRPCASNFRPPYAQPWTQKFTTVQSIKAHWSWIHRCEPAIVSYSSTQLKPCVQMDSSKAQTFKRRPQSSTFATACYCVLNICIPILLHPILHYWLCWAHMSSAALSFYCSPRAPRTMRFCVAYCYLNYAPKLENSTPSVVVVWIWLTNRVESV